MRIAVFGGTGFFGSYLVDALVEAGHRPVLLVRAGSEAKVRRAEDCDQVSGDIADADAVARTVAGTGGVIYNIGILREFPDRGISFDALHFLGAQRAMDAAQAAGARRFLLMSANGVRADGTAYQRSKYLAEQYLATTELEWTVIRPSVLFGEPRGRQEFASQLLQDVIDSPLPAPLFYAGLLPFGAGEFALSPVHVADVAQVFVAALQQPQTTGQILSLGGPEAVTWCEILARIATATGKRKLMLPAPAWIVGAAATLLERCPAFPITRDQLQMLLEGNTCSTEGFAALGITPRPFNADSLAYLTASAGAH